MHVRSLDLGDLEFSVAEAGVGGRPLLLLHGFTGAKEDFTEWLDRLAADGWHAVAPDHRGHGESAQPAADEAYSLAILADDAGRLTEALGWSHFSLLGHSMGGYVAQLMTLADPTRLDALVLMDTGHGPVEGLDPDLVAAAVAVVRHGGMDELAEVMAGLDGPLSSPAHRRVLAGRPGYAEFGDNKLRATSPHLYAAMATELLSLTDQLPALRSLAAPPPTLVMVGEQDTAFLGPSRQLAEAIAGARLAVIPDAGHSPQFENPDAWWSALSGFLPVHSD
jgi:pimeloyl-ACP methyl ester carboxylesterase